jgi:N-methylhydantoinase A/oxoprolinase/acetone carboxylase beta subunit
MNPDAPDRVVKASFKTETTSDITSGIACAVKNVIASVPHGNILSVNIGTTHFINAVVTADSTKLNPVAVLRLCGPFTREIPPFTDFPPRLRTILTGYIGYLQGGVEIDGRVIDDIDEQEVREHAEKIKSAGIRAITIVGVFSPLDSASTSQEAQVQKIIRDIIPDADIVCSRDIGRAGILERENASILNASIMEIGRQIIQGFEDAVLSMNLTCPLYLTQNDGTLMDAASACKTPIKTFSSGATVCKAQSEFERYRWTTKPYLELADGCNFSFWNSFQRFWSRPKLLSSYHGMKLLLVASTR